MLFGGRMKYLELVIHTTKEGLEPVEACLMEMGFTDMVVTIPETFRT